ncbi:MAG TPA: response regulator transcription factor [Verrucomicrobiae bacterium]|jgi:DNA-binding NarL/FixJ family response regulator|nr:response regulator transcription factor [Verrucomicrobiae bacterium]
MKTSDQETLTRIAIVEDNRVIRESLMEFAQSDPEFRCVCACSTAEEALKVIPKHEPEIVLMDIQLPNMSGIDCLAQLKRILPAVQIIMVTVYEDTERIFKALRLGACGYLLKRCTPEELIAAMREVRQGGAPMSREIARKVIVSFQEPVKAAAEVEDLSPREREILELLAGGFPNKTIADRLGLTDGTVRWHLRHVYNKLHVRSRTEAALKFRSVKTG